MDYLANRYHIITQVGPYCDMTTHKNPREEVLTHLANVKKQVATLIKLYFSLEGCKSSAKRVSDWSIDISVQLSCLSFIVPIDDASFPTPKDRAKWIYDRSRALMLLSKTPNVKKLFVPRGRQAWDEKTLETFENTRLSFVLSWQSLAACFSLETMKKNIPPELWTEWTQAHESSVLGDYV